MKNNKSITTEVLIDHREWKEWRDDSKYGAIGKLNALLEAHGVYIELAGPHPFEDFIELRAISLPNINNIPPIGPESSECSGAD